MHANTHITGLLMSHHDWHLALHHGFILNSSISSLSIAGVSNAASLSSLQNYAVLTASSLSDLASQTGYISSSLTSLQSLQTDMLSVQDLLIGSASSLSDAVSSQDALITSHTTSLTNLNYSLSLTAETSTLLAASKLSGLLRLRAGNICRFGGAFIGFIL